MPKTRWRHYAENRVAPICRKLNGSFMARGDRSHAQRVAAGLARQSRAGARVLRGGANNPGPGQFAGRGDPPQKLVSQSRFVHPELHRLVVDLFNAEVYGNIRRVQGLIRSATKELQACGREQASVHIETAIAQMRHFDKVRVPYLQMLLAQARHQKAGTNDAAREIVRLPGNPMLRYVRGNTTADDPAHPHQEKLKL